MEEDNTMVLHHEGQEKESVITQGMIFHVPGYPGDL